MAQCSVVYGQPAGERPPGGMYQTPRNTHEESVFALRPDPRQAGQLLPSTADEAWLLPVSPSERIMTAQTARVSPSHGHRAPPARSAHDGSHEGSHDGSHDYERDDIGFLIGPVVPDAGDVVFAGESDGREQTWFNTSPPAWCAATDVMAQDEWSGFWSANGATWTNWTL